MCKNGTPEDRKRWASTYYQNNKQAHADWQRGYCQTLKGKYTKLKGKAKSKGLEVTITKEDLSAILSSGICHYCQNLLPPTGGYQVDRLDNRAGYIPGNCVPCCFSCNARKGGLELAGFTYPRTVELLKEILGK
jgi:5-methylcytosine-specific restriction endonuclease McrA